MYLRSTNDTQVRSSTEATTESANTATKAVSDPTASAKARISSQSTIPPPRIRFEPRMGLFQYLFTLKSEGKRAGMSSILMNTTAVVFIVLSMFLMSVLAHARSMVSIELSAAMRAQRLERTSSSISTVTHAITVSGEGENPVRDLRMYSKYEGVDAAWANEADLTDAQKPCFSVGAACFPRCQSTKLFGVSRGGTVCLPAVPLVTEEAPHGQYPEYSNWCMTIDDNAGEYCLPEIIGLGPAKSGTTTLFGTLFQHPDVLQPRMEGRSGAGNIWEPGYFVNYDTIFAKGLPWYATFFRADDMKTMDIGTSIRSQIIQNYSKAQIADEDTYVARDRGPVRIDVMPATLYRKKSPNLFAEKSPWYISHPLAPYRIRRMLPNARIIINLRAPADRAFSAFCHMNKNRFAQGMKPTRPFRAVASRGMNLAVEFMACRDRAMGESPAAINLGISNLPYVKIFDQGLSLEDLQAVEEDVFFHCSHYDGWRSNGYRNRFAGLVDDVVWYGMYADHFRRWLTVFPSNLVLIVKSDSLYGDAKETLLQVSEWIGLRPFEFEGDKNYNDRAADIKRKSIKYMNSNASEPIVETERFRDTEIMENLFEFYTANNADLDRILAASNVRII